MSDSRQHFTELSPGKMMGLRRITDTEGRFRVLALDQSNSFKKAIRRMHEIRNTQQEPSYEEIRNAKLEFAEIIGKSASAVLLDVNFGLRQIINTGALAKGVGLLARVEASKEAGSPGKVESGWSVAQIKKMGADAVKLLVFLDMEDDGTAGQMEFVRTIQAECEEQDILLLVEELSYQRPDEDDGAYAGRKVNNILAAAEALGPHCDILKLEFPGDLNRMPREQIQENLDRLNEVAIRPWVLLSAGVDFDLFEQQVEMGMKSGASGIMAGRAIFKEWFLQETPEASRRFTSDTGVPRFEKLCRLVEEHATGWMDRYGISREDLEAAVDPNWYTGGAATAATETSGAY